MNEKINEKNSRTIGILSLVLSVLSVVLVLAPISRIIVILLAGSAILLGAVEIDRNRRGISDKAAKNMAIIGMALGGISVIIVILMPLFAGLLNTGRMNPKGLDIPRIPRPQRLKP